jgi:hypothetical protein
MPKSSIQDQLAAIATRPSYVNSVIAAGQTYELALLQNDDSLHPEPAAKRILLQIQSAAPADVPGLQAQYSKLANESGQAAKINAEQVCRQSYFAFRAALITLFRFDANLLIGFREQAVADETTFFVGYNLPREVTSVSRSYDKVIADLKRYAADLESPALPGMLPPPQHPYLTWLGIQL